MKIEVFDKDKQRITWTEEYADEVAARKEVEHMKQNHFKPEYYDIYLNGKVV